MFFNIEVEQATGHPRRPVCLFGFSGGGQFAHRFALSRPERVTAQALVAPGWYTFPTFERRYPHGLGPSAHWPDLQFDPDEFLRIATCVLVGDRDKRRQNYLRKTPRLDREQGRTRILRAQAWIHEMRKGAEARGLDTRFEFGLLNGCGHDFQRCMMEGDLGARIFGFLYGNRSVANASGQRSPYSAPSETALVTPVIQPGIQAALSEPIR